MTENLFELWWAEYMPGATQERAWAAYSAALPPDEPADDLPQNVAQWIVTEARGRGEDGRYRYTDLEMRRMHEAGTLPKNVAAWLVYCEGEPGVRPELRRDFGWCEWHSPVWMPLVYMHTATPPAA